jgi:hypothetical protein
MPDRLHHQAVREARIRELGLEADDFSAHRGAPVSRIPIGHTGTMTRASIGRLPYKPADRLQH